MLTWHQKGGNDMELLQLDHNCVLSCLPDRSPSVHKGDCGKLLLLCGSRGYTGAPALASMGALRVGTGLVYLAVPDCIYEIEAIKLTEPVILPISSHGGTYCAASIPEVDALLPGKDAVLIGPGIGNNRETEALVCHVLENYKGPIIIDADGITVLSAHKDILRGRTGTTILTPHDGEYLRFGGVLSGQRVESAVSMADDLGVIILLKGHRTIITDGKRTYLNTTGNPGMATGGSGDVLAGMIAGLVVQGIPPLEATACAAWLHGAAGDICAAEIGQYGMLPTDMLSVLPRLLK